jgi:hypothetical protein
MKFKRKSKKIKEIKGKIPKTQTIQDCNVHQIRESEGDQKEECKVSKKRIRNKNRKPNEDASYYFVAHVDSSGEVTPLLLTDVEFEKAKIRAQKNQEDVPLDFIVFSQSHK